MLKKLTDKEALQVISNAINGDGIDCQDSYLHFLEDLGKLIADHFGGECNGADCSDDGPGGSDEYGVYFTWNECVPTGGGEYAKFNTDISIKDWSEGMDGKS